MISNLCRMLDTRMNKCLEHPQQTNYQIQRTRDGAWYLSPNPSPTSLTSNVPNFAHLFTLFASADRNKSAVQRTLCGKDAAYPSTLHTQTCGFLVCVGHARREFETQPPWPMLGTNGPNFGHPDSSVTNGPILTFDCSNESQCKTKRAL